MQTTENALRRALVPGSIAAAGVAAVASLAGKRDSGSYAAPINATSHIAWGHRAALQDDVSWKYTGLGFVLNHASGIFWAAFYEKFFGGAHATIGRRLLGAATVAAGAYVTDYYLVPKRMTPGFEMRLSRQSLALVYGALALGFVAGDLLRER